MNESDDGGVVEVSEDGTTWTAVYTNTRSDLVPFGAELLATEPLFQQEVDLTSYQGKTIRLRFRYFVGPDNKSGSTPLGWYVDDILLINDNWADLLTTSNTSAVISGRPTGRYCYRVRSTYTFGSVTARSPVSNVVSVDVAPGVLRAGSPAEHLGARSCADGRQRAVRRVYHSRCAEAGHRARDRAIHAGRRHCRAGTHD